MTAHLTLYCARPVSHLTPKDVLVGTDYATFRTAADALRIPPADVESALAHLRIRSAAGKTKGFLISIRPDELSTVSVVIHSEAEDVAEWCEKARDGLPAGGGEVELVRERLSRAVECVFIRLGWEDVDPGWPLGFAVGECLARAGDALLLDESVYFHVLRDGKLAPLFEVP